MRKRRVVGRIYGIKYSWKGHIDRNRHENTIKRRNGQARLVYVDNIDRNIPPREGEPTRGDLSWPENVKNVHICGLCMVGPSMFMLQKYFFFSFECELLRVHHVVFALYQSRAQKGWLLMWYTLLPHMPSLLKTSHIKKKMLCTKWQRFQPCFHGFQMSIFTNQIINWEKNCCGSIFIQFPAIGPAMLLCLVVLFMFG